jgi:glycosyltransferase involved in cell wall biosynthesis
MRVKVAFLFVSMPVGGAEDLFLSIARNLPPEIEPHFVCLRSLGVLGEEALESGLKVHLAPFFPTKRINPLGVLKLVRWFRERDIKLVHTQTYHDQLFGVPAGKLAGITTVVHQHKTLAGLNGRKGFFMKRIFRAADHVIALSEDTRHDLIKALSLPEEKVSSLPNAVDLSIFHPADHRDSVREGLGIETGTFLIGSVASLHPTKNHQATVSAMALLSQKSPTGMKCMIFGEGVDRPMLSGMIAKNHLEDRVNLMGRKRPIAPWMQSLDLFVLPSHWEGQPMAILQALACQVPILASRIEGNVAILGKDHPGLFEPEDYPGYALLIEKAATDPLFRQALLDAQNARPLPSLAGMAGTLAALYSRLQKTA